MFTPKFFYIKKRICKPKFFMPKLFTPKFCMPKLFTPKFCMPKLFTPKFFMPKLFLRQKIHFFTPKNTFFYAKKYIFFRQKIQFFRQKSFTPFFEIFNIESFIIFELTNNTLTWPSQISTAVVIRMHLAVHTSIGSCNCIWKHCCNC